MKKFMAMLLVVLCTLSLSPICTFAESKTVTPLIILQGYSGPRLDDAETGEQVWGLDFEKVKDRIVQALPEIAGTAGELFTGNTTQLVDILGGVLIETLEPVACNPDGTSKHNVVPHITSAAQARVSTLRENGEDSLIAETHLVEIMEEKIGADNIFIFHFDWRKGQVAYAAAIDSFVQEVKALTGSTQVDIFGLSHGGQCGASYLYYYGWKGDARKVILDSPAIGGTTMVGDPLLGNPLNLDFAKILEFVELAMGTEDEFEWLIQFIGFENLNAVLSDLCERYIIDIIQNIPSIWDFCPLRVYEAAKEKRLDPIQNAKIIADSDAFHYGALQHMSEGLKRAQQAGTQIAIVAKYGHENVTGSNKNSDYIIDTETASGAYCAPFDSHFAENYTPKHTTCAKETHLHISPERTVDASAAYLPDNTWFVNGQFHGMYVFDPYTVSFVKTFYFTDTLTDVFSNPEFPQFELAQNPADSLHVRFDRTATGYHSAADSRLLLRNLSAENDIAIYRVEVTGADISLLPNGLTRLSAGETGALQLPAHALDACTKPFSIKVTYTLFNNQMLLKSKTFHFTPLTAADAQRYAYLTDGIPVQATVKDLAAAPRDTATSTEPQTDPQETTAPTTAQAGIPKTGTGRRQDAPLWICSLLVMGGAIALALQKRRAAAKAL